MEAALLNLGEVYERAKESAESAVKGSPNTDYGLEDVMPEASWATVLSSELACRIPVNATLHGCRDALLELGIDPQEVAAANVVPPAGTAVTIHEVRVAQSWLMRALRLNDDDCEAVIARDIDKHGWAQNPGRLSSVILALMTVAGFVADRSPQ